MVRKTNSYLSGPQHLGISIGVPDMRVDVRDVPQILEAEDFRRDEWYCYPKEYDYSIGRPKPEFLWGYDSEEQKRINLTEAFAKLEKIEKIELSQANGTLVFYPITALLFDVVKVNYNVKQGDLFQHLSYSLLRCKDPKIVWQKEESGFCLTISWGTATEKTFKAQTLMECFNQADWFVFY